MGSPAPVSGWSSAAFGDLAAQLGQAKREGRFVRGLTHRLKAIAADLQGEARERAPVATAATATRGFPPGYTRSRTVCDVRGVGSGDVRLRLKSLSRGGRFTDLLGGRSVPRGWLRAVFRRASPEIVEAIQVELALLFDRRASGIADQVRGPRRARVVPGG